MNNLSGDEILLIGLYLDIEDVLSLCKTSKKYQKYICQNNNFWRLKGVTDYNFTLNISISTFDENVDDYVFNTAAIPINLSYKTLRQDLIQLIQDTVMGLLDALDYQWNSIEVNIDHIFYDHRIYFNDYQFTGFNRNTKEVNVFIEVEDEIEPDKDVSDVLLNVYNQIEK